MHVAYGDEAFSESIRGTSRRACGATADQSYIRDNTARRYVHAGALTNESGVVAQFYTYDLCGITSQTTDSGALMV